MANEALLFRITGDSSQAKREAASARETIVREMERAASEVNRASASAGGGLFGRLREDLRGAVSGLGGFETATQRVTTRLLEASGVQSDTAQSLGDLAGGFGRGAAAAAVMGAAVAGVGVVLLASAKRAVEYAGQIADLSAKTNLTTDTIQSLRLAALLTGQSLDQVAGTAVVFQRRMVEAAGGNERLQAVFRALGVDLKGPVDDAFRQALSQISRLDDGAKKTALTIELFGRSGSALIPILGQLGGNFQNLEDRARELGLVLSQEGVKAAGDFGAQLTLLGAQFDGLVVKIGSSVIPALNALFATIRSGLRDPGGLFGEFFKDIPSILSGTPATNVASRVAREIAQDQALLEAAKKAGEAPDVPDKTKRGPRGDSASRERLKQLEIDLREEQRLAASAAAELKRLFDERLIDEEEFVRKQTENATKRRDTVLAILAQEAAVVRASKFTPEQKTTEIDRINAAQVEARRRTSDEIEKIELNSRQRVAQFAVQFTEAQVEAELASLARRRVAIEGALDQQAISYAEGERRLTEIAIREIEQRLALANAEVERAGANSQIRAVAQQRVIVLEQQLAAAVETSQRRIQQARQRDLDSERRYISEIQRIRQDAARSIIDLVATFAGNEVDVIKARADAERQAVADDLALRQQRLQADLDANKVELSDDLATAQAKFENRRRLLEQLAAETEAARARIALIDRQEEVDVNAATPTSDQNLFGQAAADAFKSLEESLGRPITLIERLRVLMGQLAADAQREIPKFSQVFLQMAKVIPQALGASIAAFATGRGTIRQVAASFYQAAIQPLVDYLTKLAVAEYALAAKDFAAGNIAGGIKHTLAAAALTTAAGFVGGGIAGLIAGGGGASGGGAVGNQLTGTRQDEQPRETQGRFNTNAGGVPITTTIVVKTEPGMFVERVEQSLAQSFRNDGMARKIIRNETAGEPIT